MSDGDTLSAPGIQQRIAALERALQALAKDNEELRSRLASANDPGAINTRIDRLQSDTDSPGGGGLSPGALGDGWASMTTGQRLDAMRAAVCAIAAGGTVVAECDGSGNLSGTVTFAGLPEGLCS